jgi:thiamine biosynthesis lipoprotein
MNRRRLLVVAAAAVLGPLAARADWSGSLFGAEARITLDGPDRLTAPGLDEIVAELAAIEARFSLFDPASEIARMNRGEAGAPGPEMQALLSEAGRMHRLTGGLFDPTVQPLWRALAEGGDVASARRQVGWARFAAGAGGQITLNGIAQGWAADRIRKLLSRRGFRRALVDMGEFAALGGPWAIGLEDPLLGPHGMRHLSGTALATSSPAAMRLGAEYHILGPRGEPVRWSSITVEHDSAARADAWSTALCLATPAALRAARRADAGLRRIVSVSLNGEVESC